MLGYRGGFVPSILNLDTRWTENQEHPQEE